MSDTVSRAAQIRLAVAGHIPPGQFLRYLLVGGWNTVFGYGCFFLINRWLTTMMPAYSYLAASLISSLMAITVAFLGYKWFVFRTKGNYLREWLRTLTIYSGSIFFSTLALAPLVWLIRHVTHYQSQAPYIAGATIAVCNVVISFFGHRRFSFAKKTATSESPQPQESQSSKH